MRIIFYLIYINGITDGFCLKNPKELPSELFNFDISGQLRLIGQPIKLTFTGKVLRFAFIFYNLNYTAHPPLVYRRFEINVERLNGTKTLNVVKGDHKLRKTSPCERKRFL